MTGFARTEGSNDLCKWIWIAKSVNGKGLDPRIRLPNGFEDFDPCIRKLIKECFHRGNISISFNVIWSHSNTKYRVDMDILDRLIEAIPEVQKRAPELKPPTMDCLFSVKGVIESIELMDFENEKVKQKAEMLSSFDELLSNLQKARNEEGAELTSIINAQIELIETLCHRAKKIALVQASGHKKRLHEQVYEVCGKVPVLSEERLTQEVALLMVKTDVREEMDRISAHVNAARVLMESGEAVGRQLDFLCQEFNREANTLCSKSSDVTLTQVGLALRTTIDRMREQVQNVE